MLARYNKLEGFISGGMTSMFYTLGTIAVLGYGKNDQASFRFMILPRA